MPCTNLLPNSWSYIELPVSKHKIIRLKEVIEIFKIIFQIKNMKTNKIETLKLGLNKS